MKNKNNNTIQDATGASDRWFNRNLALAFAGIAASIVFGALVNDGARAFAASLIGMR